MAEKSNTNLYWYIVLLFIIVLFVAAIKQYTAAQLLNPEINATLSDEDTEYILQLQGIDISDFDTDKLEVEDNPAISITNETGSQPKDFALEFFYSRSTGSSIWSIASEVFSLPGFIIKLLNIPENSISWLIFILNWFWRICLFIATYYFVRAVVT